MVEPTPPGDEVPEADLIEQHTPSRTPQPTPTMPPACFPPRSPPRGTRTRPISWSKQSPPRCPTRTNTTPGSTTDPHHRRPLQSSRTVTGNLSPPGCRVRTHPSGGAGKNAVTSPNPR